MSMYPGPEQELPHIDVTQDTPTSPLQRPFRAYTAPHVPRSPVLGGGWSAAPQPYVEGLQVDENGPYPKPTTDEELQWKREEKDSAKSTWRDDAGLIVSEKNGVTHRTERRICGVKRRTFIILAIITGIIIVAAAVGGGVGGYYAHQKTTASSTPPPTSTAPVTSGETGMASLPCVRDSGSPGIPNNNIVSPYLALGATYNITCERGIPSRDHLPSPVSTIERFIEYNLTSCIDRCNSNTRCKGITYGANLTEMLQDGFPGANCLLKNDTWAPTMVRQFWFASAVKI